MSCTVSLVFGATASLEAMKQCKEFAIAPVAATPTVGGSIRDSKAPAWRKAAGRINLSLSSQAKVCKGHRKRPCKSSEGTCRQLGGT